MKLSNEVYLAYVPHGINPKYYFPIKEDHEQYEEYKKFKDDFLKDYPSDFIIFWNNRNIRRKQPGDVLLSYRYFCDKLPKKKRDKVLLLMHTQIKDPNGTDLLAVKNTVCPDNRVVFSDQKVSTKVLNFMYNMSDITVNIASNEGFGLSGAESLMTGTPIVNNVTGGLQDHCRFEDGEGNWINFDSKFTSNHTGEYKKHGPWAKPVYPTNRSLQGSIPTPYIFDDRCNFEDVGKAIMYWYKMSPEDRKEAGLKGHRWVMSEESGMSSTEMCNRFKKHISFMLDNWVPPKQTFYLEKIDTVDNKIKNLGVTW